MFKHVKTGKAYYSIREKMNFYKSILSGKTKGTVAQRRKAKARLSALEKLDKRSFEDPDIIVTNDKHFGNESKPRACVVIDRDNKDRVYVAPLEKRTTKNIILDKQPDRQTANNRRWIDRSEVYETKVISGIKPLSHYDKKKVKEILRKK